jgi:molybdopterin/thiamine biosynthesis adenylyltransferase
MGRNLAAGNSVFREKDIGMPKALAMKELLQEHAPGIHVEAHQADITMLDESELRALGHGASVVLGLVDGGAPLFAINRAFHSVVPVVYAAGHRGARTGDVMLTRPQTACLQCLLDADSPDDIRPLAGEVTHGIDIVSISQVCVRVVLELLGDTRLSDAGELLGPSNFIFIENRRSPTSPRGFASRFLRIERRGTCPVRGAL